MYFNLDFVPTLRFTINLRLSSIQILFSTEYFGTEAVIASSVWTFFMVYNDWGNALPSILYSSYYAMSRRAFCRKKQKILIISKAVYTQMYRCHFKWHGRSLKNAGHKFWWAIRQYHLRKSAYVDSSKTIDVARRCIGCKCTLDKKKFKKFSALPK
jgi:hypothetical protein